MNKTAFVQMRATTHGYRFAIPISKIISMSSVAGTHTWITFDDATEEGGYMRYEVPYGLDELMQKIESGEVLEATPNLHL